MNSFQGHFAQMARMKLRLAKEKQLLIARVGKGIVSHMIATCGEEYLRITHCTQAELDEDIIGQYQEFLVKGLRTMLRDTIHHQTQRWRTAKKTYDGVDGVKLEYELVEA